MNKFKFNFCILFTIFYFISSNLSFAQVINKIIVNGNERISNQTVVMFSSLSINDDINDFEVNELLKRLYNTDFFKNVSVNFENNILTIDLVENPIIFGLEYNGIKADKIKDVILKNLKLKSRSSFNEILLKKDRDLIISSLKSMGYFFSNVDVFVEKLDDNMVNLKFDIDLGKKGKIRKISFIGNKVFKDRKLINLIVSEEYKFWKLLSGKKYLNENLINLDKRLLKNFYLNKGYYNILINSSFARLINDNEFELIFNIDAKQKIFFGDLKLKLPEDYDASNFKKVNELFDDIQGSVYSIRSIEKILEEIDDIVLNEQYESIKASVSEELIADKLNLDFTINVSKKMFIERINILGNNVTQERVIRNQLEIDEGDPFNEILQNKSINNIKSLNFFKTVSSEVVEGSNPDTKIINISITEKPTGEIMAGAGVGTSGGTVSFGVKENNFLGRGISVNSNLTINAESVKGELSVNNPNFRDSDKSLSFSLLATEIDRTKASGYKTSKSGFSLGTSFEYYDDLFLNIGTSNFYEKIETDSTASVRQKKQEGDYWDSFLNIDFDYDKRNQKFQTSDGFRGIYSLKLPILSDTYTLTNSYNHKYYTELFDKNISTVSLMLKSAYSLSDKDIKLSERLTIPSRVLRGFEAGKVGPKDGNDFIGGNFITALNFSSTLPQVLENSQNTDFIVFLDIANTWGVDYDSSLDKNTNIKSAFGIGVDWFTPIGPLNFSLAQPITKGSNDKTESFRFNLGTTF